MEHNEIIKKIIETDREAGELARQARDMQAGLDQHTQQEIDLLKRQLYTKMKRRIEIVEQNYMQEANELVEQNKAEFEQSLKSLEQSYAENCERWTEELFAMLLDRESMNL